MFGSTCPLPFSMVQITINLCVCACTYVVPSLQHPLPSLLDLSLSQPGMTPYHRPHFTHSISTSLETLTSLNERCLVMVIETSDSMHLQINSPPTLTYIVIIYINMTHTYVQHSKIKFPIKTVRQATEFDLICSQKKGASVDGCVLSGSPNRRVLMYTMILLKKL